MSKKLEDLELMIIKKSIVLIYSDKLLSEITGVINRPKFRKYFAENISELLLLFFKKYGVLIEITSNIIICRDPDDNFLLNLAVDGNADYLITGDKDLLVLEKINNTKIVTITDFKNLIY
jgi:putative PIN family toxin of toxin-antitoxin system